MANSAEPSSNAFPDQKHEKRARITSPFSLLFLNQSSFAISTKCSEHLQNVVHVGCAVVVQVCFTNTRATEVCQQQEDVRHGNQPVLIQILWTQVWKGFVGIDDTVAIVVNAFCRSHSTWVHGVVVIVAITCFQAQPWTQLTHIRNANASANAVTVEVLIHDVVRQNARTIVDGGVGIEVAGENLGASRAAGELARPVVINSRRVVVAGIGIGASRAARIVARAVICGRTWVVVARCRICASWDVDVI